MDWASIVPFVVILGVMGAMWWRLDTKIETRIASLEARMDTRMDAMNKLLTDNLIALNRDIGELRGKGAKP